MFIFLHTNRHSISDFHLFFFITAKMSFSPVKTPLSPSKTPSKTPSNSVDMLFSPRKRKRTELSMGDKSIPYFEPLDEKDANGNWKFKCKTCGTKISGSKSYNLASHLQHVHPELYEEIGGRKQIPLHVRQLTLLQNLVEIVAVNGRPFKSLLDSGFQSLIHEDVKRLKMGGYGLNLKHPNLPQVKQKLHEMAVKVRDKIKNEVSGRALSLLVDIVTKQKRSIFGVSIQFIKAGKVRVRSIGMIELEESHTGIYLANVICDRLKWYGIDLKQILTVTTDNGANVLKMVRDMDEILQDATPNGNDAQSRSQSSEQLETDLTETQTDDLISELLSDLEETTDEQRLEMIFDEALLKGHESLLSEMSKQIGDQIDLNIIWDITGVNCSAHTLQLGIKDALKKIALRHRNVIGLCRNVVKSLRLRSIQHEIEALGKKYRVPKLDVETRWGSLYLMVSGIFDT